MKTLRSTTVATVVLSLAAASLAGCNDTPLEPIGGYVPAAAVSRYSEVHSQGTTPPPVDVLWMVDDSGSMSDDQQFLGAGFSHFIPYLENLGIDFHLGIVTSDVDASTAGELVGTPAILTNATTNLEAVFAANALVGESGSGLEQGLEAVHLALSSPNVSGANAGFLRDDAILAVVILSDEDDHSLAPGATPPDNETQEHDPAWKAANLMPTGYYVDFLKSLKGGNASMVNVSAIVDTQTGCPSDAGAEQGDRYIAVASALNGVVGTICTNDYGPILDKIGSIVAGLATSFALQERPTDPSTIVVKVDGIEIAAGPNTWHYDATLDAVVFAPPAVPPACSTVEISYDVPAGTTPSGSPTTASPQCSAPNGAIPAPSPKGNGLNGGCDVAGPAPSSGSALGALAGVLLLFAAFRRSAARGA